MNSLCAGLTCSHSQNYRRRSRHGVAIEKEGVLEGALFAVRHRGALREIRSHGVAARECRCLRSLSVLFLCNDTFSPVRLKSFVDLKGVIQIGKFVWRLFYFVLYLFQLWRE